MDEQINFRATEQEAKKLKALARQMGVSVSEVLRALVQAAELKPVQKTVYTIGVPSVAQAVSQQ